MGDLLKSVMGIAKPKPLPEPKADPIMPVEDSEQTNQAKRRRAQEIRQRSGRASTVLSGPNSGTYSGAGSNKLG